MHSNLWKLHFAVLQGGLLSRPHRIDGSGGETQRKKRRLIIICSIVCRTHLDEICLMVVPSKFWISSTSRDKLAEKVVFFRNPPTQRWLRATGWLQRCSRASSNSRKPPKSWIARGAKSSLDLHIVVVFSDLRSCGIYLYVGDHRTSKYFQMSMRSLQRASVLRERACSISDWR